MCGRFVSVSSPDLLAQRFHADEISLADGAKAADYNVTPRAQIYVVRRRSTGETQLSTAQWGLVPSWTKDPKVGDRQINARAESVATKPPYRRAFEKRRCLIPADGFYEWHHERGKKRRQPVFIRARDGEPLALAGLWEVWRENEDDDWLRSCTIITTTANELLAPIHNRMPVILPESAWERWLDPGNDDREALAKLLVPAAGATLEMWPVSPLVNSPQNNGPELLEPSASDAHAPPPPPPEEERRRRAYPSGPC
ncbi:MAG: SOS response-associated peptidase [Acidimicrobiia bacterium]